ncbi:MAG: copper resistance protein NlpE N-terminal domain-containing protein [Anaerolineae bacterium]
MRRTIPLIVLVLALLALAACSAVGLPAPEEAAIPAPEAQVPEAPAPEAPAAAALPAQFVGVYIASLPAADTPGREISVELAADGYVAVISDYLSQAPIVETGTWAGNPNGTVTVTLTAQDGQEYFEPQTFLVGLEGDALLVTGESGQVVRFARAAGELAAAEAPAADISEAVTTTTVITDSRGQVITMVEVTQTVTVTAPIEAAPVITEEVGLANTYLALLPAASGGSTRLLALSLFADGTAQWTTEFSGEDTPIVELGTWVDNDDETIAVTLTGNAERAYETPVVVTFQREGDLLKTVDAEDLFGADGLTLQLAAGVVSQVGPSLVSIDLEAGFPLDPTFVSVQGGGEIDISLLSSECVGFVNRQPVVTVNWSGDAPFVEAFFVSDSDPTLAILTPDGQLLCNDDANEDLLDPVIEISEPVTGTYQIWVGSYAKGQLIPGVLVLTTDPDVNIGTFNLGALIRRPSGG